MIFSYYYLKLFYGLGTGDMLVVIVDIIFKNVHIHIWKTVC